jgi:hypothetical protein
MSMIQQSVLFTTIIDIPINGKGSFILQELRVANAPVPSKHSDERHFQNVDNHKILDRDLPHTSALRKTRCYLKSEIQIKVSGFMKSIQKSNQRPKPASFKVILEVVRRGEKRQKKLGIHRLRVSRVTTLSSITRFMDVNKRQSVIKKKETT